MTTATEMPQDETSPLMRAAFACLLAHCALMIFSGIAFATFLSPPFPEWLQTPANQRIMVFGYKWGGQTTVVFGALAGLLHSIGRLGRKTAIWVFIASFGISLSSELLGTSTGLPFGPYSYTNQLGFKILGLVPFNIPTSWFFMLYCSIAICGRLLPAKNDNDPPFGTRRTAHQGQRATPTVAALRTDSCQKRSKTTSNSVTGMFGGGAPGVLRRRI